MERPFTISEFCRLNKNYSDTKIKQMILRMENYAPLHDKNVSAFITFCTWAKNDPEFQISKEHDEIDAESPSHDLSRKKEYPVLFRESEIFDKEIFSNSLRGTQYQSANVEYYHEVILNWSDSKQAKKSNWLAAAKNWMAKDITEGKFITTHFKPPLNLQPNSTNRKQPTGGDVNTSSILSKIASMPD